MIYNNGEILDSFLPESMDDVADLSYGSQPASMAHIQSERNKFQQELSQLKDPTYREPFEVPDLPAGYQEHKTDDDAVKEAGRDLTRRLEYVERNCSEWEIQNVDFLASVSRRKQVEADYQSRLNQAVENGEDIPDPVEHEDLSPLHKELNRLEAGIRVGAKVALESREKLDAAYEILWASSAYRRYFDKEMTALTENAAKATALYREARSAIDALVAKLPDAFADLDGVPFVVPVKLGFGGMDPYASGEKEVSLSEALSKIESATVPGDGIGKWKLDQLTEDEKQSYAERAARAKVEREDTRTSEQKRQDADNERHARYLGNGGVLK
ncbi:hypothetical protein [Streptomyces sp. NBC_00151]|uniref:hypothetical protein n=1 Tax=Streptomyces sp. NBC_00151 TaxID=2975669 RepID=UPI002DDC1FE9|nr:hypothetical protein [Streptomyces sp. NBC_00151]WRZ42771.1 hypothetical protein OG915_34900 [Streptomyces sp. NBC_00151]